MNRLSTLIFLLLNFQVIFSQDELAGSYSNQIGEKIILKSDNTFEYYWNFDLSASWNIGNWKIDNKNEILLEIIEVKDTIIMKNEVRLVLSSDKISNRITSLEDISNSLSSGGQSRSLPPKRLLVKRNKLYTFSKDDEIRDEKVQSILDGNLMVKPWFEKTD